MTATLIRVAETIAAVALIGAPYRAVWCLLRSGDRS